VHKQTHFRSNHRLDRDAVWLVVLSIFPPQSPHNHATQISQRRFEQREICAHAFNPDDKSREIEKGASATKPQSNPCANERERLNRRAHLQLKPRPQCRRRSKRHRVQLRRRRRLPKNRRAVRQPVNAHSLVYRRSRIRRRVSEPQHISLFRIANFDESALASNRLKIAKTCFRHMSSLPPLDFLCRPIFRTARFPIVRRARSPESMRGSPLDSSPQCAGETGSSSSAHALADILPTPLR
jgi:hypothetical protein